MKKWIFFMGFVGLLAVVYYGAGMLARRQAGQAGQFRNEENNGPEERRRIGMDLQVGQPDREPEIVGMIKEVKDGEIVIAKFDPERSPMRLGQQRRQGRPQGAGSVERQSPDQLGNQLQNQQGQPRQVPNIEEMTIGEVTVKVPDSTSLMLVEGRRFVSRDVDRPDSSTGSQSDQGQRAAPKKISRNELSAGSFVRLWLSQGGDQPESAEFIIITEIINR